jgi:hypothetical protein
MHTPVIWEGEAALFGEVSLAVKDWFDTALTLGRYGMKPFRD